MYSPRQLNKDPEALTSNVHVELTVKGSHVNPQRSFSINSIVFGVKF